VTAVGRTRRLAVLLVLVLGPVLAGCGGLPGLGDTTPEPTRPGGPAGTLSPVGTGGATDPVSGLPAVPLTDLPPEAATTVALIDAGGPFPYEQDGSVFQNRERLLPIRRSGYYREYTVPTPGSEDRGPRRIVAGADGEMYWTADHYDSFAWIAR
jgi:ribonuclease T1